MHEDGDDPVEPQGKKFNWLPWIIWLTLTVPIMDISQDLLRERTLPPIRWVCLIGLCVCFVLLPFIQWAKPKEKPEDEPCND